MVNIQRTKGHLRPSYFGTKLLSHAWILAVNMNDCASAGDFMR